MSSTKLYFVRHGETEWNVEDKMQGISDSPLTGKGIANAKLLGEKLKDFQGGIDIIYSSTMGRASHTAAIIAKELALPVIETDKLRERNMGIFEGYSWDYVKKNFPDEFAKTISTDSDYKIPGGGDSKNDYINLVTSFLDIAAGDELSGKNILAVTHRGFIGFVMRTVLSIPYHTKGAIIVNNASIAGFTLKKGHWMLERFGEC